MPLSMQAWVLWDFATFQTVYNGLTGESRRVYGEGACFEDGPFDLVWDDEFPGRAILVGLGSEDDSIRAVHFLDETDVASVEWNADGTLYKVTPPSRGDKPEDGRWCTEMWESVQDFALQVDRCGKAPVRLHFCRSAAPRLVGDVPVSLWVKWDRVWTWLVGAQAASGDKRLRVDKGHQAAEILCTQRGLAEGHFWSVTDADARPWKRRREETEDDQGDAAALGSQRRVFENDYRVSMQGLLHWLWCVVERGYVQRSQRDGQGGSQLARAGELLQLLLEWPLKEERSPVVGVASESAMCVTVLNGSRVDGAELRASEEKMLRRTGRNNQAPKHRWARI